MSTNRRSAIVQAMLVAVAVALSAAPAAAQSGPPKTITVSDVGSFLENLGPNRTVVLKKGDYLLSEAYDVETHYVSWYEGEDGRELELRDLENLTIRGAQGARILSDAAGANVLSLYSGKKITFDNVEFGRAVGEDEYVYGGGLYAEDVENLVLDRCAISGQQSFGLELWSCPDATVKRTEIAGASSSAVVAYFSDGLGISQSKIRECEGYPLVSVQDSDWVLISETEFSSNYGGIFIEIYREDGYAESIGFDGCSFADNDFEYFSGADLQPYTDDCAFDGNSFDEDWMEYSVAPSEEEYYYGDEYSYDEGDYYDEDYLPGDTIYYEHAATGLCFDYPYDWELETSPDESRLAVYSPDGDSLVLVLTAYAPPEGLEALDAALVPVALDELARMLKEGSAVTLEVEGEGEPYDWYDLSVADFSGWATRDDGGEASVRIRFVAAADAVQAIVLLGRDESSIDDESPAAALLESFDILYY